MGEGGKGWAKARRKIVVPNIQGYEIVFLQEVQWAEKGTQKYIAGPAGYEWVLVRSAHNQRNTCILYNAERLQREDKETEEVTKTLTGVEGWTAADSERLCVEVFSLKKTKAQDSSKFVAISLHAPRTDNASFCDLMKTAIKDIVDIHKLPVLVGGDFNTNIVGWKDEGFEGLDYDAEREPIDFITMKVPEKNNHLKMKKVQKMKRKQIITLEAEDEVVLKDGSRTTVEELKDKAVDNFSLHLCGYHMPLTVDIVYDGIPTKGDEGKEMSWEEVLEEENDNLRNKIAELEKEIEEMKETHKVELTKLKKKSKT